MAPTIILHLDNLSLIGKVKLLVLISLNKLLAEPLINHRKPSLKSSTILRTHFKRIKNAFLLVLPPLVHLNFIKKKKTMDQLLQLQNQDGKIFHCLIWFKKTLNQNILQLKLMLMLLHLLNTS